MDALDIPTIYSIGGTFFEPYEDGLQQPDIPDNFTERRYRGGMVRPVGDDKFTVAPLANYKWDRTVEGIKGLMEFEPNPHHGYAVEYINPLQVNRLTRHLAQECSICQKVSKQRHYVIHTQRFTKYTKVKVSQ